MNAATQLADLLAPGSRFVYVHNTYHQSYDGTVMTVESGKWVKDVTVEGRPGGFRMELPKSAKAVTWNDDGTVTYRIVQRSADTVTLRLLEDVEEANCERAECGNPLAPDDVDGLCSYCAEAVR